MHFTKMWSSGSSLKVGGKEPDHLGSLGCIPHGPGFLLGPVRVQKQRFLSASIGSSVPLLIGSPMEKTAQSLDFSFFTCEGGSVSGPPSLPRLLWT